MSVEHLAVVLHHAKAKGTAKLVLIGVANHQGDGGAWPTVRTLARYAGITPRQVQKHLAALQASGQLLVELQAGGPRHMDDADRPNRYEVLVTCPSWCDRSTQHRDTRPTTQHLGLTPPVVHDTPPLSSTTGGPLSYTTPKPSLEPSPPTPPPHDTRPCHDCGLDQAGCARPQANWPPEDRHTYRPTTSGHATAHRPADRRPSRAR